MQQSEIYVGQRVNWIGSGNDTRIWTVTSKPKNGKTVWLDNKFRVHTAKLIPAN